MPATTAPEQASTCPTYDRLMREAQEHANAAYGALHTAIKGKGGTLRPQAAALTRARDRTGAALRHISALQAHPSPADRRVSERGAFIALRDAADILARTPRGTPNAKRAAGHVGQAAAHLGWATSEGWARA